MIQVRLGGSSKHRSSEALDGPSSLCSRLENFRLRNGNLLCTLRSHSARFTTTQPPIQVPLMASSAAASAIRRAVSKAVVATPLPAASSSGVRQFHATGAKRYSNDYLHAEHMYDIQGMKTRKLKMAVGVFGSLAFGFAVPIWAVHFQLTKSGGGM